MITIILTLIIFSLLIFIFKPKSKFKVGDIIYLKPYNTKHIIVEEMFGKRWAIANMKGELIYPATGHLSNGHHEGLFIKEIDND